MADSKEDLASQALARLGEGSISSFSEDSDAAEKVNQLYEDTILSLLSAYDWSFAQVKAALTEDGAAMPVNEWERGFLMPALRTVRVGKPIAIYNTTQVGARPMIDGFEVADRWVFTDQLACVIDYTARKPESQWPGYFTKLAIEAMAATLALPVTESITKEQHHVLMAYGNPSEKGRGGYMGQAMAADASGSAPRSLIDTDDLMASARFGGY